MYLRQDGETHILHFLFFYCPRNLKPVYLLKIEVSETLGFFPHLNPYPSQYEVFFPCQKTTVVKLVGKGVKGPDI